MTEKVALVFLDDHETYSSINSYIKVFEADEEGEYDQRDPLHEINVGLLIQDLIKAKELLPEEIQKIIEPLMDCHNI
jgi:hypothetical protein